MTACNVSTTSEQWRCVPVCVTCRLKRVKRRKSPFSKLIKPPTPRIHGFFFPSAQCPAVSSSWILFRRLVLQFMADDHLPAFAPLLALLLPQLVRFVWPPLCPASKRVWIEIPWLAPTEVPFLGWVVSIGQVGFLCLWAIF